MDEVRTHGCAVAHGLPEDDCETCGGICPEVTSSAVETKVHLPVVRVGGDAALHAFVERLPEVPDAEMSPETAMTILASYPGTGRTFVNEHVSVSRLRTYEECPRKFAYRYVEKVDDPKGGAVTEFGKALHAGLEDAYRHVTDEEYAGPFPVQVAIDGFRRAFTESGLTGLSTFQEGIDILRRYAARRGDVDHARVLGVEREFRLKVGRFTVLGYIDLLEREDAETVVVRDYKSNRALYTRDALNNDLQMAVYAIVARDLYPWATRIRNGFDMLRHDTTQWTERSVEQLDEARAYVEDVANRTETDTAYRAILNNHCEWCDHHRRCPTFQAATRGQHEVTRANKDDLDALVKEWAEVTTVSKAMYARKMRLQDVLKAKLETEGPFEAGGYAFKHKAAPITRTYPVEATVDAVARFANVPPDRVASKIVAIDDGKVQAFLADLERRYGVGRTALVREKIRSLAQETAGTPAFDFTKKKGGQR